MEFFFKVRENKQLRKFFSCMRLYLGFALHWFQQLDRVSSSKIQIPNRVEINTGNINKLFCFFHPVSPMNAWGFQGHPFHTTSWYYPCYFFSVFGKKMVIGSMVVMQILFALCRVTFGQISLSNKAKPFCCLHVLYMHRLIDPHSLGSFLTRRQQKGYKGRIM